VKRNLAITIGCLFAATLISVAILLAQVVTSWPIVLAIVLLLAVFGVGGGILLVTNTRPSWPTDPYAQTTDELLRGAVLLPDGRPYGRRDRDDRNVVDRLSDILEEEAAKRPPSERTPPWAIEVAREQAPDATDDVPFMRPYDKEAP
jgi:hypothetical protein